MFQSFISRVFRFGAGIIDAANARATGISGGQEGSCGAQRKFEIQSVSEHLRASAASRRAAIEISPRLQPWDNIQTGR